MHPRANRFARDLARSHGNKVKLAFADKAIHRHVIDAGKLRLCPVIQDCDQFRRWNPKRRGNGGKRRLGRCRRRRALGRRRLKAAGAKREQ